MKMFAIKVCIKGRLASLFETGGKGGIGISAGDPVEICEDVLSSSDSVRYGSDEEVEVISSSHKTSSTSSSSDAVYITEGRLRKYLSLRFSNHSKSVCVKKWGFENNPNCPFGIRTEIDSLL